MYFNLRNIPCSYVACFNVLLMFLTYRYGVFEKYIQITQEELEPMFLKKQFKHSAALFTACSLLAAAVLTGCGQSSASTGEATGDNPYNQVTLLLSCNGTDTANDTRAAQLFAEMMHERTDGAVTVNVFPNDQLSSGSQNKAIELVAGGTVDLDLRSTSILASLDNRIMVSTLPWLFPDYQAAEDAFFGTGGEFLDTVLEPKGLTYIGAVHNGFKAMTTSKRPIREPKDLKGLKFRIPGGDFFTAFYSALGASPQGMSWSEVFTALQQGTIDGQDNSLSTINSANVQEVQKYISLTNHTYEAFTFVGNSKRLDSLNEATRALLFETAEEACREINKDAIAEESEIREKFELEGCEVIELAPEAVEEFKQTVAPVTEKYKAIYGEEACRAFGVE